MVATACYPGKCSRCRSSLVDAGRPRTAWRRPGDGLILVSKSSPRPSLSVTSLPTLRSVDSTIAAAIITAISSGAIAALGIFGTLRAASKGAESTREATARANTAALDTTRLTLAAEHERRLWERRAEVYVELLAESAHQQAGREYKLKSFRRDEATEKAIADVIRSYVPRPWFELEARVRAFASEQVIVAYDTARRAHMTAFAIDEAWQEMVAEATSVPGGPAAQQLASGEPMGLKVKDALTTAHSADTALMEAIRAELHSRPGSSERDTNRIPVGA